MRKQPIHEDEWDYLIVLDACRFDEFEKHYEKYLEGDLEKVRSRGSATPEWLTNTWTKRRYNINYITANPYVNSSSIGIGDLVDQINSDWKARDRFTQINEAWVDRWHEKGTVHPDDMRVYSEEKIEDSDIKKTVIHFIQPHRPFISNEGESNHNWYNRIEAIKDDSNDVDRDVSLKYEFLEKTRFLWSKPFHSLPERFKYYIREFTGMGNNYRGFVKEHGLEKTKEYYSKDLDLALENISELIEKLDGKVVVTADHGESWGEKLEWGHPLGSNNPVLVEVPWLEIE